MVSDEIKVKELEIELEKLKIKKLREAHKFKVIQLGLKKEIAQLYRPKKKKESKR